MKKYYPVLTYAGTLPFTFCTLCFIFNIQTLPLLGQVNQVLGTYSVIISSFIAGSHWGIHLNLSDKWEVYLPIFSNINAIFIWISFIIFPFKVMLLILVFSFLALWLIDQRLFKKDVISRRYFHTRSLVTLTVTINLIISGIYA